MKQRKTIASFLAARTSSARNSQMAMLDNFVSKKGDSEHLHFIKYWGGSVKQSVDQLDLRALIKLFGFLRTVEGMYTRNVHLTLIFTDTHVDLNGYPVLNYLNYFREIEKIISDYNYNSVLMSDIIAPYLKTHLLQGTKELTTQIINQTLSLPISVLSGRDNIFGNLKRSAAKHSYRFTHNTHFADQKFDSADQAAYAYIRLNEIEKTFIERQFKDSIFLTYTSENEQKFLAPNLTLIQIYSYKSGVRSRPWFSHIAELNKNKICVA